MTLPFAEPSKALVSNSSTKMVAVPEFACRRAIVRSSNCQCSEPDDLSEGVEFIDENGGGPVFERQDTSDHIFCRAMKCRE